MDEIKLNKRYKYAGDIFPKLIDIGFDIETATDFLNNIKDADVVEVVRCKDCKRCYEKRTKLNNQLMRFCMRMDGNEYQVNANDFCSYGTPKERGGEKCK